MSYADGNLLQRSKRHDWESIENRDLMERIELVRELKHLSNAELAPILKSVSVRTSIIIIDLVKRFRA